jgi:heptosyltransferase-2
MIDQAVQEWGVNLDRSYLIGDQLRDIELAKRVGARSILVTTGVGPPHEAEKLKATGPAPDWIASSLTEAADWLLADAGRLSVQIRERQVAHPLSP